MRLLHFAGKGTADIRRLFAVRAVSALKCGRIEANPETRLFGVKLPRNDLLADWQSAVSVRIVRQFGTWLQIGLWEVS